MADRAVAVVVEPVAEDERILHAMRVPVAVAVWLNHWPRMAVCEVAVAVWLNHWPRMAAQP